MKMRGEDWGILVISIFLAILLPWWVIVLLPFLPLLLVMVLCGLLSWK